MHSINVARRGNIFGREGWGRVSCGASFRQSTYPKTLVSHAESYKPWCHLEQGFKMAPTALHGSCHDPGVRSEGLKKKWRVESGRAWRCPKFPKSGRVG